MFDLVRAARAFAFGAPLAFLAASFLTPPDPLSQLLFIAVGLMLFVPAAYVSVADTGNTRTLVVFFSAILLVTVAGSLVANALGDGTGLRLAVLAIAVSVGAIAALQYG